MALGHFLMAIEGAFLFALLALIVGVGLFKGNIATQVGELYAEHDLRRAMAFQIFYIFINVSVIAAPLISGTLGQKVGWHYGFGCAGVVMVLGLVIYLSGQKWLPADLAVAERGQQPADRPRRRRARRHRGAGRRLADDFGHSVFASGWSARSRALVLIAALYFFLTRNLDRDDKLARPLAVHPDPGAGDFAADQPGDLQRLPRLGRPAFNLTFMQYTLPSSWLITLDAILSFSMLVAVAAVLEMVEPQAPRAGRDQQDDHRQLLHHRRRRCACSWPR